MHARQRKHDAFFLMHVLPHEVGKALGGIGKRSKTAGIPSFEGLQASPQFVDAPGAARVLCFEHVKNAIGHVGALA